MQIQEAAILRAQLLIVFVRLGFNQLSLTTEIENILEERVRIISMV